MDENIDIDHSYNSLKKENNCDNININSSLKEKIDSKEKEKGEAEKNLIYDLKKVSCFYLYYHIR